MRNEIQKFNETVQILVQAFFDNTLAHGTCAACAVGNMIAAKKGIGFTKDFIDGMPMWRNVLGPSWGRVFMSDSDNKKQRLNLGSYNDKAKDEIDSTGYTVRELARIEFAFETADGNCADPLNPEWMFNGLMAVVDVLAQIHGIDLTTKESAKLLFVKPETV